MLIQTLRSLGVAQSVARHIDIKKRDRGYDEATFVESFVVLNGVGGDCLDDFDPLRADAGLASMLGHELPSPGAARNFLYEFHDESRIDDARQQCTLLGTKAYIPPHYMPCGLDGTASLPCADSPETRRRFPCVRPARCCVRSS